jgi:hypothetical protein
MYPNEETPVGENRGFLSGQWGGGIPVRFALGRKRQGVGAVPQHRMKRERLPHAEPAETNPLLR